jgi:hypothetical protein
MLSQTNAKKRKKKQLRAERFYLALRSVPRKFDSERCSACRRARQIWILMIKIDHRRMGMHPAKRERDRVRFRRDRRPFSDIAGNQGALIVEAHVLMLVWSNGLV